MPSLLPARAGSYVDPAGFRSKTRPGQARPDGSRTLLDRVEGEVNKRTRKAAATFAQTFNPSKLDEGFMLTR